MAKTEALATAQKFIRSKKDYQSPYYWAPFVLVGDWK
jgi:CHAT domain-containing protein